MTATLHEVIALRGYAVADGAMGTQLFAAGLGAGESPESWNLTRAEELQAIHGAYLEAGADLVVTNSFGGNRFRLALHGLEDRCEQLNEASVRAARRAARAAARRTGRVGLVAGSMGPTGELLAPMGDMTADECRAAFAQQAAGLAEGGADLLWIETMSDLGEVEAAVAGARSVCDLPVAATMSFDTSGRTMMGVTGAEMAARLGPLRLAAVGANCGNNLDDTEAAATAVAAALPDAAVIFKPNAGVPVWQGQSLVYDGTPELMAAHAHRARASGATVIGSCCGSTPAHTARIAAVLRGDEPPQRLPAPGSDRVRATGGRRARDQSRRGGRGRR